MNNVPAMKMSKAIWVVFALFMAGCATQSGSEAVSTSSAPPAREGPQIANHEAVDWGALDAIGSIEIEKLDYRTTQKDIDGRPEPDYLTPAKLELQFFPKQKLITFDMVAGDVFCTERGQTFNVTFVASPGAEVSDQLSCVGQNILDREQVSMNYKTTSNWKQNMLTLDGNARIHETDSTGSTDFVVDLHSAIQVSGLTCRVISWRQSFPKAFTFRGAPDREDRSFTSTADTTCTVTKAGGA